jgi:phosphopentomutase
MTADALKTNALDAVAALATPRALEVLNLLGQCPERGYRAALEEFDAQYARLAERLRPDDLVLLTADHGNDPLFTQTTDHTREYVPVLADGAKVKPGATLGTRESFADIGATVEDAFGLPPAPHGRSFLAEALGQGALTHT